MRHCASLPFSRLAVAVTLTVAATLAPLTAQNAATPAPTDPDLTAEFEVPDGLRVTRWAESPLVYNPTAMDVDTRGRLWVTEAVNYRKWGGRNPGREHAAGDRVVILQDTDGDGVCDSSKVFAQDADLVAPLGIAVLGDRVFVSCSPHLFVYRDTDGDDVADERETFLTGFGGFNHDHGLHSVTQGPDGTLWFNAGNAGPHLVTDADGWKLASGSIYTGGGPEVAPNKPGLISSDGRAWTGGIVLRVGQDGGGLRVVAHNFRNPYEVAVDSFGDLWQSDNDDDGNRSCRTMWVQPGGDYGFFSADGARTWQADRRPGQATARAHWHADDPGVSPPGSINGGGGPTGVAVYENGLLPPRFEGAVLNCDAGASVVYAHHPRLAGGGFELERDALMRPKAGDRSKWFRPSDVVVGSDGAVYVADWWDPGVGGHAARDREAYGRILRIAPEDGPKVMPDVTVTDFITALTALRNPALHVRAAGQEWFVAHAHGAHLSALQSVQRVAPDARMLSRAMFLRVRAGDEAAAHEAFTNEDPRVRVAALRAHPALASAATDDPSPLVRRAVADLIADQDDATRLPVLTKLAGLYTTGDRHSLEALGNAARGIEDTLYVELLATQEGTPRDWDADFADLVWRLHPESAIPALMARIMAVELPRAVRVQAVDTLAFMTSKRAAEAMLTVAESGPTDTESYAYWWCSHRATNDWAAHGISARLGTSREGALELFTSPMVRSGSDDIDVDLQGCRTLWLVVGDGGNGNSCDWADWIDPVLVGPAGELSVVDHGWVRAQTDWGQVGTNANAGGGPLAIGGVRFAKGIGVHADSEIMIRVPDGYSRLRATIGPDDGGTSQNGGATTSVRFAVFGAPPEADPAEAEAQFAEVVAVLTDGTQPTAARAAAAATLTQDPAGGALLLKLATAERLDAATRDLVAQTIFAAPSAEVRARASAYFARPGRVGDPLPPIEELAVLPGDHARGAALYHGRAGCAACHSFEGRGLQVGPDLTRIRDKFGSEGLLDSLLNPSAAIAFGYETWVIELEGGRVLSGPILADGAKLVVQDLSGERVVVDATQVKSRTEQRTSVMPSVAALGLSAQDIADVRTFLLADAFTGMRTGDPVSLFDGETLDGWKVVGSEGAWSAADGVLACEGRPIGYLRTEAAYTNYVLTLEWRTPPGGKPGNSGVLLRRTGPDTVWPHSIEAQLHSGNAGDIWNIGAFPMRTDPDRTNGRRTVKAAASSEKPLGAWNRYEIILRGGDLRLSVNGVVQNEAQDCDERAGQICLQSEGAPMEFRNIVLRPILD